MLWGFIHQEFWTRDSWYFIGTVPGTCGSKVTSESAGD